MKDSAKSWKHKLEKEIEEYASCNVSPETISLLNKLGSAWLVYDDICTRIHKTKAPEHVHNETLVPSYDAYTEHSLTTDEIHTWNERMLNADGSAGGHWSEMQTTNLANVLGVVFEHITPAEWNVTCNMMYSDYYMVAQNMGVDTPEFYGWMAKAFLFDKDGPEPSEKLCAYYHYIVAADD